MGYPMAGHLAAAGHDVRVYNRTAAKAAAWVAEHGGRASATPAEAAAGCDAVFVCVGNDNDVRDVVLGAAAAAVDAARSAAIAGTGGANGASAAGRAAGEGALATMPAGAVLVDHTTASARLAHELAAAAAAIGVGFVDAPVSGGQAGAQNGSLTVMCGGNTEHFDVVAPIMTAYARACTLIGPTGSGQLTKMVNQIAIAGLLQGLAEALNFGRRAGLDMDTVIDVIGKGAAQSWQLDNRARTMVRNEFDFGFAVEWMHKDLGICLDESARNGAALDVTRLIDARYRSLIARGAARLDTSSLIRLLT